MYQMAGISKQAHYKRINHLKKIDSVSRAVIAAAQKIRDEHGKMGCRKIYSELKPLAIGRDKTEALLLKNGFRIKRKRNYHRTTYAGKKWYPNLITNLEVTGVNQLWVSDMTYISVGVKKHYYLTLILDVYSRKIKGWSLSDNQTAQCTVIAAFKRAMEGFDKKQVSKLIFHSDRGSQYSCDELEAMHIENNIDASMGGKAWENAHAESLNGILKNEYIDLENTNIKLLPCRKLIKNIIEKYNNKRPHGSLKNMKPVEFETFVQQLTAEQKPIFKINY